MLRNHLTVLLVLGLAACSADDSEQSQPAPATATETALDPVKGIDWFDGSVDDAFAAAKASGKPVYLYWGAAWCPPCHAISATIFKSPEFIERSKLFIPVYLDGDTENAQAYGEKFGVRGYPTMIVFDAAGTELTRIPGGIDLQAYANILDVTLGQTSSATALVAGLANGSDSLSTNDCTLLAYYSWSQDSAILADYDATKAYRQMYDACPATLQVERSMLYFAWLGAAITAANATEHAVTLSAEQKAEAVQQVHALLVDDQMLQANIFTALFSSNDFLVALTEAGSTERATLMADFTAAYDRIAADEAIYKRERIYTLIGRINLERIDDSEAALSAALQERIRSTVQWADATTPSVYERQPIINALGNVLLEAGMDEAAKPLLLAELEKSKQPYYFMVELADIEQRAGNFAAAIDWLQRAYDATQGPATRFQWGNYYLAGLLEMQPDNTQLIHDTAVSLIAELQNSSGLYQRPKAQLTRMQNAIVSWSEMHGHAADMAAIRESVLQVCAAAKRQDASRATCDAFLESVG